MPSPIAKNKHELTRAIFPYDEKILKKKLELVVQLGYYGGSAQKQLQRKYLMLFVNYN